VKIAKGLKTHLKPNIWNLRGVMTHVWWWKRSYAPVYSWRVTQQLACSWRYHLRNYQH